MILNKFATVLWTNIIFISVPNISSIVRKALQSMFVHYHLATLGQNLDSQHMPDIGSMCLCDWIIFQLLV